MRGWMPAALAKLTPKIVVMVCGENDIMGETVTNTVFEDFKAAYALAAASGARVFFMSTKPEPGTTALHAAYQEYDALIVGHAQSVAVAPEAPLVVIDSYLGFEDLGNPTTLYASDSLHLSATGYAQWGAWLRTALDSDNRACFAWRSGACAQAASGWPPGPPLPPASPPSPPFAPGSPSSPSQDGSQDGSEDGSGDGSQDSAAAGRRGNPSASATLAVAGVALMVALRRLT